MIRDRVSAGDAVDLPLDAPWAWPESVSGIDAYQIDVDSGSDVVDGKTFETFTVRDCGIGMTPQQMADYFLTVGRSYYRTPQFLREFVHPSISRFGVRFSLFLPRSRSHRSCNAGQR